MNITNIRIDDIRLDGGTQTRTGISEATLSEYADAIVAGAVFPAVVVFFDGTDYFLADGFHRLHGHRQAGCVEILADVRTGTRRDAVLYAVGANAEHGLRRTNDDKRKAVRTLLEDAEWGQWSDREIAKQSGTHHKFVGRVREELSLAPGASEDVGSLAPGASEKPAERKFTTKHGTEATMDTANIGKKPSVATARDKPTSGPVTTTEPEGPSAEEIAEARRSAEDDAEAVRLLLESDDKLAAMTEKVKQQAALIRTLQTRITGLTNEAAQAIRLAKSWRTKYEKLERAAA